MHIGKRPLSLEQMFAFQCRLVIPSACLLVFSCTGPGRACCRCRFFPSLSTTILSLSFSCFYLVRTSFSMSFIFIFALVDFQPVIHVFPSQSMQYHLSSLCFLTLPFHRRFRIPSRRSFCHCTMPPVLEDRVSGFVLTSSFLRDQSNYVWHDSSLAS